MNIPREVFPDPRAHALAEAVAAGDVARALVLAGQAPDGVNTAGTDGSTPLLIAVLRLDKPMVQALLAHGADPNGRPGQAPIAMAVQAKDPWFADTLLRAGANPDGLIGRRPAVWQAAIAERHDMIDRLAAARGNLDMPDGAGDTATMAAAKADLFATVLHLLDKGASPFATNSKGQTLAFWIDKSLIDPASTEGGARHLVIVRLGSAGAWPPPPPPTVRTLLSEGRWPPPGALRQ